MITQVGAKEEQEEKKRGKGSIYLEQLEACA